MKMRAMKGVESEKEAELRTLLTPDQFQKFQASKDEMREKIMDRIKEQRAQAK
jgi:hypothetical protein